jgi:hypothetical protein
VAFEDETIITQRPCIRKSMSFEGEQQKIEHTGSRKRFSALQNTEEKTMKCMFCVKDARRCMFCVSLALSESET